MTLRTDEAPATKHQTQVVIFKRGFDCEEASCQDEANADVRGLLKHFSVDKMQVRSKFLAAVGMPDERCLVRRPLF